MQAGANLPAVSGYNQAVILDAVRRAGDGVSRAEVAKRTGLSAQTISNVTRRLIEAELIVEAGTLISGVGKPPTMLRLEPGGRFALGVHLDPTVITVVLLDMAAAVVSHRTIPTPASGRATKTIDRIASVVAEVITEAGVPSQRLMGLGVAAPGPLDTETGTVLNPPLLSGWGDVAVRDELAVRVGLPVLLEKDVTAAAVAETWSGNPVGHSNMAFFYYGTGVGCGLVIDNEVVRGASNNAGDVGSMVIGAGNGPDDRRWRLGDAVLPRFIVRDAIERGILPATSEDLSAALVLTDFGRVADAARAGDARALDLIGGVARDISTGLVTIVNLLDIDRVVFGGPYFHVIADLVLGRIPELVHGSPDYIPPHTIDFSESSIGEDVAAIGAACLVLDHAFSPRPAGLLIQR